MELTVLNRRVVLILALGLSVGLLMRGERTDLEPTDSFEENTPEIGMQINIPELVNIDGERMSVDDGNILVFVAAPTCVYCRLSLPSIQEVLEKRCDLTVIFAIVDATREEATAWRDEVVANYPGHQWLDKQWSEQSHCGSRVYVLDADRVLSESLGHWGTPRFYLVENGVLRWKRLGAVTGSLLSHFPPESSISVEGGS